MMKHDAVDEEQVAPKPWQMTAKELDRSAIIDQKLKEHPTATADEIVVLLAAEHVEVSGTLVMQRIAHLRGPR
jgi:hypothetical protein